MSCLQPEMRKVIRAFYLDFQGHPMKRGVFSVSSVDSSTQKTYPSDSKGQKHLNYCVKGKEEEAKKMMMTTPTMTYDNDADDEDEDEYENDDNNNNNDDDDDDDDVLLF